MATPFKQVFALWITPDFTPVAEGRRSPPYIDHDKIDFAALSTFFEESNRCGETVKVRFANDTIDQVTLHFRGQGGNTQGMRCEDFADALLSVAKGAKNPVDVRHVWEPLHHLKDRNQAPPPMALMFVVEGGFEAVTLWASQFGLRLGIKAATPLMSLTGRREEADYMGRLPAAFAQQFESSFGIGYESAVLLDKLAHTPFPSRVQAEPL